MSNWVEGVVVAIIQGATDCGDFTRALDQTVIIRLHSGRLLGVFEIGIGREMLSKEHIGRVVKVEVEIIPFRVDIVPEKEKWIKCEEEDISPVGRKAISQVGEQIILEHGTICGEVIKVENVYEKRYAPDLRYFIHIDFGEGVMKFPSSIIYEQGKFLRVNGRFDLKDVVPGDKIKSL